MGPSSSKPVSSSASSRRAQGRNSRQKYTTPISGNTTSLPSNPVHTLALPAPISMPIPAPAPAPPTEDILLALSRFDTVLLVDDSKSMRGSRWTQAGKALSTLATIAARYDEDGIDIEFLNSKRRGSGMKDEAAVNALFTSVTPRGWTPLGTRLDAILSAYQCKLKENPEETKPLNLIVITDGAPTDDPATEDAILRSARALDVWNARITQLGIQFVQIGNDARARAYLEALDDGLSVHGVRDMVDTTPSGAGDGLDLDLVKILIGAVNRRVDNKGSRVLTGKS